MSNAANDQPNDTNAPTAAEIAKSQLNFGRIPEKNKRNKASSQYRIRIEQDAVKAHLRTGTHYAIISVNENINPTYFSTTQDCFKMIELVAALERSKVKRKKKVAMSSNLQDIIASLKGNGNSKGMNYMTTAGQHLLQMGIDHEVLNAVRNKYIDSLVDNPNTIDPAADFKRVITQALRNIVKHGFRNSIVADDDDY